MRTLIPDTFTLRVSLVRMRTTRRNVLNLKYTGLVFLSYLVQVDFNMRMASLILYAMLSGSSSHAISLGSKIYILI